MGLISNIYRRAFVSKPVNRVAVRIIHGEMERPPNFVPPQRHWQNLPKIRSVPIETNDLTGYRFGLMKVVGLYSLRDKRRKNLWVVKCFCGRYETRHRRAIATPSSKADRCPYCRHIESLRVW
jgi:hypothetical protein